VFSKNHTVRHQPKEKIQTCATAYYVEIIRHRFLKELQDQKFIFCTSRWVLEGFRALFPQLFYISFFFNPFLPLSLFYHSLSLSLSLSLPTNNRGLTAKRREYQSIVGFAAGWLPPTLLRALVRDTLCLGYSTLKDSNPTRAHIDMNVSVRSTVDLRAPE